MSRLGGWWGVGKGNSNPEPSGSVVLKKAAPRRAAEPSWGQILATTVKLSVLRWVRALGFGAPRAAGRLGANRFRPRAGHQRWLAAWRWRLSALLLALALVAMVLLRVTGVLTGTASAVTRSASPGSSPGTPSSLGRGSLPGRGLDRRPGERQRDHRVLSRHVRRTAGAGCHGGPADAAEGRRGQPARGRRDGDLPVGSQPAR